MKNTPKKFPFSASNSVNKLGASGGKTSGKVNFPAGKKMSFASGTKTVHKSPIHGQKASVSLYHSTKGKKGKI